MESSWNSKVQHSGVSACLMGSYLSKITLFPLCVILYLFTFFKSVTSNPSIFLFIYLSLHLSIYLSIYLSTPLHIYLSQHVLRQAGSIRPVLLLELLELLRPLDLRFRLLLQPLCQQTTKIINQSVNKSINQSINQSLKISVWTLVT